MSNRVISVPDGLKNFVSTRGEQLAAVLGGLLQNEKSENFATLSRLVQGLAKGDLRNQLFRELIELHEKGSIKEDFYQDIKSRGFRSFVDVLRFLDSDEAMDAEKLAVLKRLFYSIVEDGITDVDEIVQYQLFEIVKQLRSSAILVIAANYRIFLRKGDTKDGAYSQWVSEVARELGHGVTGLVEMHEDSLEGFKLIGKRIHSDLSGIDLSQNFRLTDLGIKLGEFLVSDKEIVH